MAISTDILLLSQTLYFGRQQEAGYQV